MSSVIARYAGTLRHLVVGWRGYALVAAVAAVLAAGTAIKIANWRADWGQGDFPFLFVQLAAFGPNPQVLGESDWAELREAQLSGNAWSFAISIGKASG